MSENAFIKTQLRIPKGLHKKLTAAIERTGRSMNSEIVERLIESFQIEGSTDDQGHLVSRIALLQKLAKSIQDDFDRFPFATGMELQDRQGQTLLLSKKRRVKV